MTVATKYTSKVNECEKPEVNIRLYIAAIATKTTTMKLINEKKYILRGDKEQSPKIFTTRMSMVYACKTVP